MENKLKVWIARDKDGSLHVSQIKPKKEKFDWVIPNPEYIPCHVIIDANRFPSVKWEDEEPTEAYITLAESQEQTKQEQSKQEHKIDWEQRRYEIAKEMLPVLYQQSAEILKCGQSITWEDTVGGALVLADMLIAKLKEQSE